MAGENLIITIRPTLAPDSPKDLQKQLDKIAEGLKLTIPLKIDENILKTLKDFSTQMTKIGDIAKNTGKVIQESFNPDGSRTKNTFFTGINGEFQTISTAAKELSQVVKDATKQELASLDQVSEGFSKTTKEVIKYNSALKEANSKVILSNDNGTQTRSVNMNSQGQVTGYTDTINLAQQEKLDKLAAQEEQKLIEQIEQFRLQSIQRVQQRQLEMDTAQQKAIQRNMDLTRQEVEQQKQLEIEINRRLQLYQREAQITATNISSRYGQNVNQSALNSQLSNVMSASPNQFSSLQEVRNFINDSNVGFRELTAGIQTSQQHVTSFGDAMKNAFAPMTMYFSGFMLFTSAFNEIKSGISYINDLNHSLTTIAIITHQTQDQVQQLGQQYQQLGSQLNVSTSEIAASAAELIRQGLSMDEVNKRLTLITEFSRIAGISAQDATKYITAATNSMQISAQKASDTFALLGHVSGVNAEYIATAFQKVGGSAGALGLDFNKVASWITTEGERTKESAETIGQSIKSIIARIQSMREKGFDESDGTKINQVAKALDAVGIKLTDNSGQFRNFGTVMDELGGKWDTLDSRQKAYISTTVAGTYQQSKFLDLMQGYSRSVDLYKQALDSAGTTQSKFNEWQQGTEAQIAKLTNTMQSFWMSAFNSKDIQLVLSGFNSIVSGLKSVTDAFGFLPTLLGGVTAGLLLFNTKIKESYLALVTNVKISFTEMGVFSKSLLTVGEAAALSSGNMSLFSKAILNLSLVGRGTTAVFETLSKAIKGFALSMATTALPVAGIMIVSAAIEKLTQSMADQKAKEEALQKQTQNTVDAYSNHKSKIDDLVKSYGELSDVKNKSGYLNPTQEQQYIDVQNQLAKLLPSIKAGEDAKGNAILESNKAIQSQIDLIKEQISLQEKKSKLDAPQKIVDNNNALDKNADWNIKGQTGGGLQQQLDYYKWLAKDDADAIKNAKERGLTEDEIKHLKQDQLQAQIQQNIIQGEITAKAKDNAAAIKDMFGSTKIDSGALVQITNVLGALNYKGKSYDQINGFLTSVVDNVNKLDTALTKNNQDGIDKAEKGLESIGIKGKDLNAIIDALTNAQKQNTKANQDSAISDDQMAKDLQNAKGNYSALLDVMQEYTQAKEYDKAVSIAQGEAYTALSDKISPVNKMLEDMANGQTISASSAMDLISKNQEMAKYITITGNQVQINTQGILDWRDAQIKSYADSLQAIEKTAEAQTNATLSNLKNYKLEISAISDLASAKKSLAELQALSASIQGPEEANGKKASDSVDQTIKQVQSIIDIFNNIDNLSKLASTGLTQVGTSIDKTSSSTQQSTYVTDKYKQAMDQLNNAMQKVQSLQQKYPQYSQQYRDALQQEINLLKQQKDLTDAQATNLQKQIDSGQIQQTGMITKSNSNGSASGSSSSNYNYASGGSTQAQIWNFLKGHGLSDGAIAGIMGNMQQENSLSTADNSGGMGLVQWIGSRRTAEINYAKQNGLSPTSLEAQMGYLWQELSSGSGGLNASQLNGLSASQAALLFSNEFERPNPKYANNAARQQYANQFLSQFAGSNGSTPTGLTDTSKSAANMAQDVDQAKSQVLQLQQQSQQYADAMQADYLKIIQAGASMFDHIKATYDSQISQYDYLQSVENKNGADWLHTQMNREAAIQQQIKAEQDSINYLQQQIQYNNQLTEAQKATLSDDVLNRQKDLLSIEQKLFDTRNQMATEIVDTYKQALTDMKDASTKAIDNEINAINKAADSASYKKKLTDAQQSAQDIQNQITQLMLDDSTSAKKKISDLQKQLTTQNDSITQMVSDNNKQQQIDNLNTQKQTVSDYYDNMLNDTRKFTQMQSDILNLNNQGIINDLNSFSTTIQKNVNILGTSVVNTIIDMVNRANGYMSLSTANSSVIGHVASLDSGGLLSGWGSQGKLAMLHEKEIVLNKNDTSNFLKAINFTRDFFSNIKLPDLSGFKMNPAVAGGNNYYVNFNVDKMSGNQNDVNTFVSKFVNGIKSKGGNI